MTFLHLQLALAGFACVAIPIVIHFLFRRRRKPQPWGAMRFLLEALKRQRRRLQLEQLLLLLARCLVVACVAGAVGRPILKGAGLIGGPSGREVMLIIDNTLASSAVGEGGERALERHKRAAAALLDGLSASDTAGLVLLGAPAERIVVPPASDLGAVRALVQGLEPTDAAPDWEGALAALEEAGGGADRGGAERVAAVFSDFLLGSADTGAALAPRSGLGALRVVATRPAPSRGGNTQVIGVEPMRAIALTGEQAAGESQVVRVALRRTGATDGPGVTAVRLSVVSGGADARPRPLARSEVRWSPGQAEAVATMQPDVGALASASARTAALIAEIDADAVAPDNVFRRPLALRETLRVGVVDRERFGSAGRADQMTGTEWLRLALRPTGAAPIEVVMVAPTALDAAALAGLDAVVLPRPDLLEDDGWRRVRRFVDGGGLALVFPPAEASVHSWADAMERALDLGWRLAREARTHEPPEALAEEQPESRLLALVRDELADLVKPVTITRTLPLEEQGATTRAALRLRDGSAWVVAGAPGSGSEAKDARDGESSESGLVVYIASAPELAWTDMPAKPLMVPLVQEIVRQGAGAGTEAWAREAGSRVRAPRGAAALAEEGGDQSRRIAVDASGLSAEPVRRAALLRAVDDRGATRGLVAVNAAMDAGRTDAQPEQAVARWLAGAMGLDPGAEGGAVAWLEETQGARALADEARESGWSLPLLIAALCLALLETLMARWFSHAQRDPAEGEAPGAPGGAGSVAA